MKKYNVLYNVTSIAHITQHLVSKVKRWYDTSEEMNKYYNKINYFWWLTLSCLNHSCDRILNRFLYGAWLKRYVSHV